MTLETLEAERTSHLVTYKMFSPVSTKTKGTIRKNQYPTAYFLDKSKLYGQKAETEPKNKSQRDNPISWSTAFKPVREENSDDDFD